MAPPKVKSCSMWIRAYDGIERVIALFVPAALLVFICIFISTEISVRLTINYSFYGIVDLVELALPMLTFLSLAEVQRKREHIIVDVVTRKLSNRKAGLILECILLGLAIVLIAALLVLASWYLIECYKGQRQLSSYGWPRWPFVTAMPLGILFMLLRQILQFSQSVRLIFSSRSSSSNTTSEDLNQ